MCLSIPMRVMRVSGITAQCEARGVVREVNLFLLLHEPVAPGDYVLVDRGHAVRTMAAEDARATWALYDEWLAAASAAADGVRT
jgi:hydrogenase expression/formation protein HypC